MGGHLEYFNKLFCLQVSAPYACFTRPEFKVERVSYDVITPSAARAIFEAIFWKPAIHWQVKKIEVLKPIHWFSIRRNEVAKLASSKVKEIFVEDERQQKHGLILRDVAYRLYAELEFIPVSKRVKIKNPLPEYLIDTEEQDFYRECLDNVKAGKDENPGKYNAIFERRAKKGQCFYQPYLGCREFSAEKWQFIELDSQGQPTHVELAPINEDKDLGFMLYDMDFQSNLNDPPAAFYRPKMEQGVIAVPEWNSSEVLK